MSGQGKFPAFHSMAGIVAVSLLFMYALYTESREVLTIAILGVVAILLEEVYERFIEHRNGSPSRISLPPPLPRDYAVTGSRAEGSHGWDLETGRKEEVPPVVQKPAREKGDDLGIQGQGRERGQARFP